VGAMAVVPLDVHSRAGGDVDFNGLGVNDGHMDSIYRTPRPDFPGHMGEQMVKFHIDLCVEVCPWRVVFENQQLAIGNNLAVSN
jgi:hypothetical protein